MLDTINYTRRELYMSTWDTHPDEMIGATDLDCENDLRGLTGDGAYRIDGYCSQPNVDRCSNCSLCNYGRDCHNNKVAK
ncbi:MAG TPA: hypothetical protein DCX45_03670 [Acinetobacter junii]|nr:hypothetical protein [Acinetobacter junii]